MSKISQATIRNQAADILEAAMVALMIPTVWGKGAEARLSNGTAVDADHPKACTFCSVGAVEAARQALGASAQAHSLAISTLDKQARVHRFADHSIVTFNDARNNKQPVLEVFAASADSLR
jgi:prophage DNA circulation protein